MRRRRPPGSRTVAPQAVASRLGSAPGLRRARRAGIPVLLAALSANASAQVVARVILEAPADDSFLLHATRPVPPGTYVLPSVDVPLRVTAPGGPPVPTQVEVVSHYPNLDDGADVIEVIARVTKAPGVQVGDPITYGIRLAPHTPRPARTRHALG